MKAPLPAFLTPRARGVPENPASRFERLDFVPDPDWWDACGAGEEEVPRPSAATLCFKDDSQSILSRNDSPDIGFSVGLNPYRGCEHGCPYCYARPYHEYLGFGAGLDFETKILVKPEAPKLLRRELSAPSWKPEPLICSGVTDCYQPLERVFRLTRACLEVLVEFRQPVRVVTKNRLVVRDTDLLQQLAGHQAASVLISVTTLDPKLASALEPRASTPLARLGAIGALSAAGVPVGVSVAPVIPGLNDHEIPGILRAAREHGATHAIYSVVRLPYGLPDLFFAWVDRHYPERRERVERGIRDLRGGEFNDSCFGARMEGAGSMAETLRDLFHVAATRSGLTKPPELSTAAFRRPGDEQLLLF